MSDAGALGAVLIRALLALPASSRVPLLIAVVAGLGLWANLPPAKRLERLLLDRRTPAVIGVASAFAMWYAWGSLHAPPMRQDESALLLQADLFAAGRWADRPPPILRFFEQPHILVTPALASAYPPGHSLMLALGVWLRVPGLIPVLLLGLSGGLLFALTRNVVGGGLGPWAALLAWVGWIGLRGVDASLRPSYVADITTSALWLVGWWAFLRWRDRRSPALLCVLALCIGWGAITRPLTMLAFAVPLGAVVIIVVVRQKLWRQLGYATAVGGLVLAVIPFWNARTTGDWRVTPTALYNAQYLSGDTPRSGALVAPARAIPPAISCVDRLVGALHRQHLLLDAPAELAAQLNAFLREVFVDWRSGLVLLVLVALVVMPIELACAVGSCALLIVTNVGSAHDPQYSVYSMDADAVAIALAALGICAVLAIVGRRLLRRRPGEDANEAASRFVGSCAIGLVLVAIVPTVAAVSATRQAHQAADAQRWPFRAALDAVPSRRSVVFVRYAPDSACGKTLIENHPPLATARTWMVYDRGDDNDQLLRVAPDRLPFLFDASNGQLYPYPAPEPSAIGYLKPADAGGA